MKKYLWTLWIVLPILILGFFLFLPIDPSKENSVKITGIVKSIKEGGVKDMVIALEDHKNIYYINRGFENGFNLDTAKKDFIGKKVILYCAKHWTGYSCKHITQFSCDNKILYSEW